MELFPVRLINGPWPVKLVLAVCFLLSACRSSQDYVERGNRLYESGKPADAVLEYRKAIQKEPSSAEAHYRLGLAELAQQHYTEAYRVLNVVLQTKPDHLDAAIKLADVNLGLYLGDPFRPKAVYDQLVKVVSSIETRQPQGFDTFRLKGHIALQDRRAEEAIKLFQAADKIRPNEPSIVESLTRAFMEEKRYQESEALALRYVEKDKTNGPIWDLLYIQYQLTGRKDDAERIALRKVEHNPSNASFILQLAGHYQRTNRLSETDATLERLLKDEKQFPDGILQVGGFYESTGQIEKAVQHFEKAAGASTAKRHQYLLRAAVNLNRLGHRDKALAHWLDILSKEPANFEAQASHAVALIEGGDPKDVDKAITILTKLVERQPDDSRVRFALARGLVSRTELGEARKHLNEVLRLHPGDGVARLLLTQLLLKMNLSQQALESAERLTASQPDDPNGRFLRAVALLGVDRTGEGDAELVRLVAAFPDFREAWLQLGVLRVGQKRFKEADTIFQRAAAAPETYSRAVRGLAMSQIQQGRTDDALALLAKEVQKAPDAIPIRETLASAALSAGRYEEAIEQLRYLSERDPQNKRYPMAQGVVYQRMKDIPKAIPYFEKAAAMDQKSADPYLQMGYSYMLAGDTAAAIGAYRKGLARQPEHVASWNDLAYALAESGTGLDEALQLALKAQRKLPKTAPVLDTVGYVYLKRKAPQNAIKLLEDALKSEPANPSFRYHFGLALAAAGQKEKAKEELQRALANSPPVEIERKIKEEISKL